MCLKSYPKDEISVERMRQFLESMMYRITNGNTVESVDALPIEKDASSPVEKFFLALKPGHTPDKSIFARMALEWIEDWEKLNPQPIAGSPTQRAET